MTKNTTLAPIVLFVYNRPAHTRRTIESLAQNTLASQSIVHIFSDGPKNSEIEPMVSKVRHYLESLKEKDYFKQIHITHAIENKGLATSVIDGVTRVVNQYGKVIVLEDDLLTAPDFLSFLNDALDYYKTNPKIGSISGYSPLSKFPEDYVHDIWTASRISSLGWGTWKERWDTVDWQISDFNSFKKDRQAKRAFNACGTDQLDRLYRQIHGNANSWATLFAYWQFRSALYTVFPVQNRVQHIGWDGSGSHAMYQGELDTKIINTPVQFKLEMVDPDKRLIQELKRLYSGPIQSRIARWLRTNELSFVESFLRKSMGKS